MVQGLPGQNHETLPERSTKSKRLDVLARKKLVSGELKASN
jgi:hypothetical protein